jgi:hypothetical protein
MTAPNRRTEALVCVPLGVVALALYCVAHAGGWIARQLRRH